MFNSLPDSYVDFMDWPWEKVEPYYQVLLQTALDGMNVDAWLQNWTRLGDLLAERYARLSVAIDQDTTDQTAEERYNAYLDQIYPQVQAFNQKLKQKLLDSGLKPAGFENPLRRMRQEAEIFRQENIALLSQERKLSSEYNKVIGAQTVAWDGDELTLQALRRAFQTPDRDQRARAWRLAADRQLADRQTLNELWRRFMELRRQLAENAGLPDYRSYRWRQMLRLDYNPADCIQFQAAIEQAAVPAASRLYERHRQRLGVETLRPWDLDQDLFPLHQPPMPPYGDVKTLKHKVEQIFRQLDPQLADYFHTMRSGDLLDLDNRVGKAPGGYCTSFPAAKKPFIFMNAIGLASDVRTLIHEAGHAFHNFERLELPYAQQRVPGLEFAEVASMAMELLAAPYLSSNGDGLYAEADARRFRQEHLEHILAFWPYMAVVDAFQHWVYTNHEIASDPAACDEKWFQLWQRYLPRVDWDGLEEEAKTGWHRKIHIFIVPLYYVEYGLAQLGAVQVWRNALDNPQAALESYRAALALGGTKPLPALYQAAGAKFAFDAETLTEAVLLVERTIDQLETNQPG